MNYKLYRGDCLEILPKLEPNSVDLVFFSPPYWDLRKYTDSRLEIGYGQSYKEYLESLLDVILACHPLLKDDGNLVINIMDLVRDNSPLRIHNDLILAVEYIVCKYSFIEEIIWFIRNKMPVASDKRFCNKFERLLHFTKKSYDYYFDKDSVREPHSEYAEKDKRKWKWNSKGKCPGNVWDIPAHRVSGKNKTHSTSFCEELCERVIKCWSPEGGVILDPFCGGGNALVTGLKLKRKVIGIELSRKWYNKSIERIIELKKENENV